MLVLQISLPRPSRNVDVRHNVSTTSDSLLAAPAVPDADGLTLDGDLSAECAGVAGVLGDFHLLDLLPQGGTISRGGVRLLLLSPLGSFRSLNGIALDCRCRGCREEVFIPGTVFTGDTDLCQIVSCCSSARQSI